MSIRKDHLSSYTPPQHARQDSSFFEEMEVKDIRSLYFQVLKEGMHGLCFSLYEDGQAPGDTISEEQIRRRIALIAPYAKWVRSFSTTEGNELIPKLAKEYGMKTLVGCWLSDDIEKNKEEVESLIRLGSQGYVDIAAVGNEVLYRDDLPLDDLLQAISKVKEEFREIPVGYVDAYYEFTRHERLSDACDVILSNCYPFWEGTHFNDSLSHMQYMFQQSMLAAKGKRVIVTETGWPSRGESLKGAEPNEINAMKYFIQSQLWSTKEKIDLFYFSSFDESWKKSAEGEVGAFLGIFDKNEKLKYQ